MTEFSRRVAFWRKPAQAGLGLSKLYGQKRTVVVARDKVIGLARTRDGG